MKGEQGMSYSSMAWDDVCCDFPGCGKEFDKTNGARVAIVDKGDIKAFCREHCARLIEEGIELRVLSEIHREKEDRQLGIDRARQQREQLAREKEFIDKLKKR